MLSCLSRPAAVWLFVAATALHNLEEALWLPGFAGFPPLASVPLSWGAYLICGPALAMSVNAVAPHLVLSLARRSNTAGSAPCVFAATGPATALLLLLVTIGLRCVGVSLERAGA